MKKVIKNFIIKLFGEKFFRLYIYGFKVKIHRIYNYKIFHQKTNKRYETLCFGSDKYHTFFGYYDISPINKKDLILANQTSLINKSPDSYMEMRVGYYQINNNKTFNEIGSTNTWCWQQGCRLQWYNEIKVIYNKMVDGDLGCVIQNIDTKEIISKINYPIYSIAKNENWGLTLNFDRLNKFRPGYGYSLPKTHWKSIDIKNDGIWKVDFENNCGKLIIPLEKIIELDCNSEMNGAKHYINHIQINPSNKRFLFFHLTIFFNM